MASAAAISVSIAPRALRTWAWGVKNGNRCGRIDHPGGRRPYSLSQRARLCPAGERLPCKFGFAQFGISFVGVAWQAWASASWPWCRPMHHGSPTTAGSSVYPRSRSTHRMWKAQTRGAGPSVPAAALPAGAMRTRTSVCMRSKRQWSAYTWWMPSRS
eukprot:scaffold27025_cov36-Phaeocystis_antarctica.AAC.1